ncbi:MAG: hypothetical protein J6M24_04555 [Lachnospiraceae bacterium]|nr:hypothetical protein [Lachnospiraceae bacterium]
MDGGRVAINIKKYQNDMTTFNGRDDVLTLLIHLGYLGYEDKVAEMFELAHDKAANKTYNDE